MATLQLYTVTHETHVYAFNKEEAEEKARMILEAGNAKKSGTVRVDHVGPAPRQSL